MSKELSAGAAAAAECSAEDRQLSGASPGAESAGGWAAVRQREECARLCALPIAERLVSRSAVRQEEVAMKEARHRRRLPGSK